MFYFQTNKLGFGAEFLGRVRLVAALASLAGVGLFNFSLKSVPFRKIFLWTSVSGTVLGLSQLLLITGEPAPVIAPLQSLGGCRGLKGCKHISAGGEGIWGAGTQYQCARLALCMHWNWHNRADAVLVPPGAIPWYTKQRAESDTHEEPSLRLSVPVDWWPVRDPADLSNLPRSQQAAGPQR